MWKKERRKKVYPEHKYKFILIFVKDKKEKNNIMNIKILIAHFLFSFFCFFSLSAFYEGKTIS